jgi:hypothetical protein
VSWARRGARKGHSVKVRYELASGSHQEASRISVLFG